jgi:hypothetical protein
MHSSQPDSHTRLRCMQRLPCCDSPVCVCAGCTNPQATQITRRPAHLYTGLFGDGLCRELLPLPLPFRLIHRHGHCACAACCCWAVLQLTAALPLVSDVAVGVLPSANMPGGVSPLTLLDEQHGARMPDAAMRDSRVNGSAPAESAGWRCVLLRMPCMSSLSSLARSA